MAGVEQLQLHVEDTREGALIVTRTSAGAITEALRVVGLAGSKHTATILERVPGDVTAHAAQRIAELKRIDRVSVLDTAALDAVKWESGPTREGFVDARQYANILKGEPVTQWSKGVLGYEVVDNEEMARMLAAGTTTWKTMTRAKWKAPLRHRVPYVYELYREHLAGRTDRRLLAVLGRR